MMDEFKPFKSRTLYFVYAPGCHACKAAGPELEKFSKKTEMMVVQLNAAAANPHKHTEGVRGTPTYILVENGEVVRKKTGGMKLSELQQFTGEDDE